MKTLIFGPANAGKTSLMRTTSRGESFLKVIDLPPTRGISRETYLFRGLLEITIWDAGGQKIYQQRYFSPSYEENIFSDVELGIYMLDAAELPVNKRLFKQFVKSIHRFSPEIKTLYVLLNKIDLREAEPETMINELKPIAKEFDNLKIEFTPVSVKEGTAQKRLVEILDKTLAEDVARLEKLQTLRKLIEEQKSNSNNEYVLFNRPDGLVITSTFGQLNTDPLNYLSLDMAFLESNLPQIFTLVLERMGKPTEGIGNGAYIYESDNRFMLLKEVNDFTLIMVVTSSKESSILIKALKSLDSDSEFMKSLHKLTDRRSSIF